MNHRMRVRWIYWRNSLKLLRGHRIPIKLKQKFYKIHVSLATLYGPEYWTSTKQHVHK